MSLHEIPKFNEFSLLSFRRILAEQRRAKSNLDCYDHEKVCWNRINEFSFCLVAYHFNLLLQSLSSDSDSSQGSSSR